MMQKQSSAKGQMTLCPNAHDCDIKHDLWTISGGRQDLLLEAKVAGMETKMVPMEEKWGNYGQGGNNYRSQYR
eukprot:8920940-Ditylum_brightwellii.AAC.1